MKRPEFVDELKGVPEISGGVWIYGIGESTMLLQQGLQRIELKNFKGYCVDKQYINGSTAYGKPLISIDEVPQGDTVLINSLRPAAAQVMLENAKAKHKNAFMLADYVLKENAEKVLQVYDLLGDQKSKEVYAEVISARMRGKKPAQGTCSANQYFCWEEFSTVDIGRSYVDCGAFVGDTIEQYIVGRQGLIDKIVAFEPDDRNLNALEYRLSRLKREWALSDDIFEVIPCGLAEKTGELPFCATANSISSSFVDGTSENKQRKLITTIDKSIKEPFTFLKADIESWEYSMLLGAKKMIRKCKPCIAITLYHNCVDLFSIPLLIASEELDYRFAVRHHSTLHGDTVLYAWVE